VGIVISISFCSSIPWFAGTRTSWYNSNYMATFSFDIVSEYDKAEMNNVYGQTEREIGTRYDFKGTPAAIEWMGDKKGFKITGSNEWQIDAVLDIVRKKLATRELSSKVLDLSKEVHESNLRATKEVPFVEGLDQEKAKQITKLLKEQFPKVKTQIQGEAVRVTSGSKDDLQAVMTAVRSADLEFVTSFTNYR
jgi:cyclic-di-GMP-binding protein